MIHVILPSTPEREKRRKECLESLHENAGTEYEVHTYISEGEGWPKAVQKALRGVEGLCVVIGDDMRFSPYWLKVLKEAHEAYFGDEKGLSQPFDEVNHGRIAVCPMADAELLRELINTDYHHNFCDTELTMRMQMRNKYLYVPESVVFHDHPITGRAKMDKTYESTSKFYKEDEELYLKRRQMFENGIIKP